MLGKLTEFELGQLENTKKCCEDHADDMCCIMGACDPCDGEAERALLEGL